MFECVKMLIIFLFAGVKACVRRRAILSVSANPNCSSKEVAEKAVNEVWKSCFADTRPFDEVGSCSSGGFLPVDVFLLQIY